MPFVAEVLKICHFLSLSAGRPRALATSVGVIACSMSCLFANTTRMAFFSSSSWRKYSTHNSECTQDHHRESILPTVSVTQFNMSSQLYLQHGHQLGLWDAHPVAVAAVDDVYDRIRVWVVASPVGPIEQSDDKSGGARHRDGRGDSSYGNPLMKHLLCIYISHIYKITNLILVCPPKSHTWNFRFLHVIVSTLKPIAV